MRYVNVDEKGKPINIKWFPLGRDIVLGLIGIWFLLNIAFGSWYTIDQTEMGNLRRFGTRVYAQPMGPGLHFKIPFIDEVDRIRVTLNTIVIPPFNVSTVDNQIVTVSVDYNYTIPSDRVNHLLYEVGGVGSAGIHDQAQNVVKDRVSAVFSGRNMVEVNANHAAIQADITTQVHDRLQKLFGIEPHSLQIPMIQPSASFMASNERAVRAKNDAVAAENQKRTIQFQADQAVIQATGEADAVKARADGNAYALLADARAQAESLKIQAAAVAQSTQVLDLRRIQVEQTKAERWNGQLPQSIYAGAPIPFLNVK